MRFAKMLVALVTGLMAHVCAAQVVFTLPTCIPKTFWTPFGTGTDWVRGFSQPVAAGPSVSYRAWWCPQTDGSWKAFIHRSVDSVEWSAAVVDRELDTAARSFDKLEALRDAVGRYQRQPTTAERFAWFSAGALATAHLQTIKPPAPAGTIWRTPASGQFTLYVTDGVALKSLISGRKATANALCRCDTTKVMSGTSTYCALASGPATEVTLCRVAQQ